MYMYMYVCTHVCICMYVCVCINQSINLSIYICSSVGRAFAHDAMDRRIDPSWWTHSAISRSSQCSTTGVTKAVVCAILSVGWCI